MLYVDLTKLSTVNFPSGEFLVRLDYNGRREGITFSDYFEYHRIVNRSTTLDFMKLGMVVDCIRNVFPGDPIHLDLSYIPFARQDRRTRNDESLSIKVFADILNKFKLDKVRVYDPHSDVSAALINNVEIVEQHVFAKMVAQYIKGIDTIVAPDAGAAKKAMRLAKELNLPLCQATKVRDTETGKLSGFRLLDPNGKSCLIVDDICDGGGTFICLSKLLREAGAESIYLYVTHGLFTNGIDCVAEHFDRIFTSDSFRYTHPKVQMV